MRETVARGTATNERRLSLITLNSTPKGPLLFPNTVVSLCHGLDIFQFVHS